jgi:hypothetical protein
LGKIWEKVNIAPAKCRARPARHSGVRRVSQRVEILDFSAGKSRVEREEQSSEGIEANEATNATEGPGMPLTKKMRIFPLSIISNSFLVASVASVSLVAFA